MEQLTLKNLEENFNNYDTIFIDFYANWCGPCRAMSPVVDSLSEELEGKVKFFKVDVDQEGELAARFGVQSIPTFFVVKDSKVVNKAIGMRRKEDLIKLLGL